MQVGNVFTIEPMICEGTARHLMWDDQWTATTMDGGRSAQFEHTLLVTPDGVEALTARLPTSNPFFWEGDTEYTLPDPPLVAKPLTRPPTGGASKPAATKGFSSAAKKAAAKKKKTRKK